MTNITVTWWSGGKFCNICCYLLERSWSLYTLKGSTVSWPRHCSRLAGKTLLAKMFNISGHCRPIAKVTCASKSFWCLGVLLFHGHAGNGEYWVWYALEWLPGNYTLFQGGSYRLCTAVHFVVLVYGSVSIKHAEQGGYVWFPNVGVSYPVVTIEVLAPRWDLPVDVLAGQSREACLGRPVRLDLSHW